MVLQGSVMFCTLACEDYDTIQYQNFSEGNPFNVAFVTKMKMSKQSKALIFTLVWFTFSQARFLFSVASGFVMKHLEVILL